MQSITTKKRKGTRFITTSERHWEKKEKTKSKTNSYAGATEKSSSRDAFSPFSRQISRRPIRDSMRRDLMEVT